MRNRTAAVVAAAIAMTGVAVATPARAATPHHVAIVIAGKGVACVPWHSGITGDEVLNDVATVRYRNDGLITQIDGIPKNNLADATHYWSYWHNTGSGWKYSTSGASAYQPRAGTVEGWHFIKGSSTATPPPVRSYSSICSDTAPASPPPVAPSTHPSSRTAYSAPRHTSSSAPPSTSVHRTTASTPAKSSAGRTSSSRAAPSPDATASTPATGNASPMADGALPSLTVRSAGHRTDAQQGSALPTVLVVVVVAVLGGAAAFVARRRRRA